MAVLIVIIILDILIMALVMRLVKNEPPYKHPSAHPLAIQYATRPEAPAPKVAEQTATPEVIESVAADSEDDGKTELGE